MILGAGLPHRMMYLTLYSIYQKTPYNRNFKKWTIGWSESQPHELRERLDCVNFGGNYVLVVSDVISCPIALRLTKPITPEAFCTVSCLPRYYAPILVSCTLNYWAALVDAAICIPLAC